MKNTIKLNDHTSIDLSKLIETRLLVQANSGGGKSYAIRRIVEQAFGKVQIIILDPEGEFINLREEFDFVYAGKGGDAPVESRSAGKLAERLLELKASTIVDLYELAPQDRKHFVRLFCEAMVNASKELWHDTLIIIDEAHVFAPEKGESEAMGPVIDLATRGRKRGYCVVLATQRLPKLNKDAAAECNNKLIGRASQDIDRKRAADELGFTTREQILSLRDLDPGEFYAFGPAISREVIKIKIGEVKVVPPKRGSARSFTPPPPSAAVKKILAELKDLPQEAEKEARTVQELKQEVAGLKRQVATMSKPMSPKVSDADAIKRLTDKAYGLGVAAFENTLGKEIKDLRRRLEQIYKISSFVGIEINSTPVEAPKLEFYLNRPTFSPRAIAYAQEMPTQVAVVNTTYGIMGKGELLVLAALAQYPEGMSREHITVQTGYKRSTRDAYIQRLAGRGYTNLTLDGKIAATQEGIDALGSDYKSLPNGDELVAHHLRTLPEGEAKILQLLVENGGEWDRDRISEKTDFKRSTRDAYIQRLATRQLVEVRGGSVSASKFLFS